MKPYKDKSGIWHIDDVPIVSTGINYRLSTGWHTFTQTELEGAVEAQSDIAIKQPRIKLGHASIANDLFLDGDEPAFGRVEAMRLSDNHQTVYGNYVGTPDWLSEVLPVAYPSRSVDASLGVETVTGKQYPMVITDVSLLGVRWPGCSVLEDLPLWYGQDVPEGVEIDVLAAGTGGKVKKIGAEVDVSLVRRKFYNDGPGQDEPGWWIRGERFDTQDGYSLIVDMGDGELCRYPVSVDGSDISFGDYSLVTEEYPDKAIAASAVLAGMRMADPAMIIHASRADTDERPETETHGGTNMDEATRTAFASRLGLPEDATEEQIDTEIARLRTEGTGEGAPAAEEDPPAEPEPTPEPEPAPAPEAIAAGSTVTLDREAYEHLKRGADTALAQAQTALAREATDMVNAAVEDGRIPPARRDHWNKLAAADFEGTKTQLSSLEKGLIPVKARGGAGSTDEGVQAGDGAGFPREWFPEIANIHAEAEQAAQRRVMVAKEG